MDALTVIDNIKMEDKSAEHWAGGEWYVVTCPNGYGASIIRNKTSYGGDQGFYEVAVTHTDGKLCYSTPITNDVIGWLHPYEVKDIVEKIILLPPNKYCTHSGRY
jgi:hypothetical protein